MSIVAATLSFLTEKVTHIRILKIPRIALTLLAQLTSILCEDVVVV